MGKYEEKISDSSLWMTATPTPLAKTLPFFISEAGHFLAETDYRVQRDTHDSFLMIYTLSGQGAVQTEGSGTLLPPGCCAVIDCHTPHEYHTISEKWDFLWIHFNGSGIAPLLGIIYPNRTVRAVNIENCCRFESDMSVLIRRISKNDVAESIRISSDLHSLLNAVCLSAL